MKPFSDERMHLLYALVRKSSFSKAQGFVISLTYDRMPDAISTRQSLLNRKPALRNRPFPWRGMYYRPTAAGYVCQSLCFQHSLCVCFCFCFRVCICSFVCLFAYLCICLFVCLFICLLVGLFVYLFV